MGNASILGRHPPGPATEEPAPAPTRRLMWTVYWMRFHGDKLERLQIANTARTGRLVIRQIIPGRSDAFLLGDHDIELGRLEHVRVHKLLPTGTMVLHGVELYQTARVLRDDPQAWYCVLNRQE